MRTEIRSVLALDLVICDLQEKYCSGVSAVQSNLRYLKKGFGDNMVIVREEACVDHIVKFGKKRRETG